MILKTKEFRGKVFLSNVKLKDIRIGNKIIYIESKYKIKIGFVKHPIILNGENGFQIIIDNKTINCPLSQIKKYKVLDYKSIKKWFKNKSTITFYDLCESYYEYILKEGQEIKFYITRNKTAAFTEKYSKLIKNIKNEKTKIKIL